MRYLITLFFCFQWGLLCSQQEQPTKKLSIESYRDPYFEGHPVYKSLEIRYPITDNTVIELRGLNQQNAAFRRLNARLILKQRLLNRVMGVIGYENEWDLTNPNWQQETSKSIYIGLEYVPKSNLSIHAGLRKFINQPNFKPLGTESNTAKSQFNLGSKLKF